MQINDQVEIFEKLKEIIKKNSGRFNDTRELPGRFEVWNKGEIVAFGKKRKEIYFCGLIIQSNYVGFYYMPTYVKPEIKELFSSDLLKLLKGKSCFHVKSLDSELLSDIDKALKLGVKLYDDNGWIN